MTDYNESMILTAKDERDTKKIAEVLSYVLQGKSACLELVGDVGAGKTTFTQYFVAALGSQDTVTSPTFTLENVYTSKQNVIHHFDLYRLQDVGLMPEEVDEALQGHASIVIVEWADILHQKDTLPRQRIVMTFAPQKESETARTITIKASSHVIALKELEELKELQ